MCGLYTEGGATLSSCGWSSGLTSVESEICGIKNTRASR